MQITPAVTAVASMPYRTKMQQIFRGYPLQNFRYHFSKHAYGDVSDVMQEATTGGALV